jgi:hypothetical protein
MLVVSAAISVSDRGNCAIIFNFFCVTNSRRFYPLGGADNLIYMVIKQTAFIVKPIDLSIIPIYLAAK